MNIAQGLAHAVKVAGNRPAISCGETEYTWSQFAYRTDCLARGLAHLGVRRGDRVAVLMLNCHRYFELYYACARMGAVIVPLNTRLAPPEIDFILTDSEARVLIVDQTFTSLASRCERSPRIQQVVSTGRTDQAEIVVGADGMRSLVARTVQVPSYRAKPARTCVYFGYWSGVPLEGCEIYVREQRAFFAFPTNDDLTCIAMEWPLHEFQAVRADLEGNFLTTMALAPHLVERVQAGRREGRFMGSGDLPNFYRKPYGPGWALVGDAGYHKDPYLAQGISDAFRDAELVSEAIDAGLSGRLELAEALGDYELQRNEETMPIYEWNYHLASLEPPSPEMYPFLSALRGNQTETNRFFGILAGTIPVPEFFMPERSGRVRACGSQ
jgi:2-polyprenyl-6-methoxyphenol hydroxylase-like FAD-dependent oxidoreductase